MRVDAAARIFHCVIVIGRARVPVAQVLSPGTRARENEPAMRAPHHATVAGGTIGGCHEGGEGGVVRRGGLEEHAGVRAAAQVAGNGFHRRAVAGSWRAHLSTSFLAQRPGRYRKRTWWPPAGTRTDLNVPKSLWIGTSAPSTAAL